MCSTTVASYRCVNFRVKAASDREPPPRSPHVAVRLFKETIRPAIRSTSSFVFRNWLLGAEEPRTSEIQWPISLRDVRWKLLAVSTLGFTSIATDVMNPYLSWHILQPLDSSAHEWVKLHTDSRLHFLAGKILSNAAIYSGLFGWSLTVLTAISPPPTNDNTKNKNNNIVAYLFNPSSKSRLQRQQTFFKKFFTSAAVYITCGGGLPRGDPLLVDSMKHYFQRLRPSPESHHTFSFPSGHTTAAAFILGTLFYVLQPAAQNVWDKNEKESIAKSKEGGKSQAALAVGTVMTASGRVLADAHWTSDVMAGAMLGMGLVCVTSVLCDGVDVFLSNVEEDDGK